jgi:hypothetical protein
MPGCSLRPLCAETDVRQGEKNTCQMTQPATPIVRVVFQADVYQGHAAPLQQRFDRPASADLERTPDSVMNFRFRRVAEAVE